MAVRACTLSLGKRAMRGGGSEKHKSEPADPFVPLEIVATTITMSLEN